MSMTEEIEIPKWDIALEAVARQLHHDKGRPLRLADFQEMAREHAVRLDDIMVTMFQLAIHGEWEYRDAGGEVQPIDADTLSRLYVNRRLTEPDLAEFTGDWRPCQPPSPDS